MTDFPLKASDADILQCLKIDPRMSVSDIAQRVGIPVSTARHRLNKLIADGSFEISVVANPFKLGYQIWVIFEIQAELGSVQEISRRLAQESQLYFVGITTGRYDLWAAGIFRSNEDLLTFTTERLSTIEGIKKVSTSNILKLVKRMMPSEN